jgi:hypothetical protein
MYEFAAMSPRGRSLNPVIPECFVRTSRCGAFSAGEFAPVANFIKKRMYEIN